MAMQSVGRPVFGAQPQFRQTEIGSQVGESLYDPITGKMRRTGKQKGTEAGQALKALQEASGLNLLGSSNASGGGGGGVGSLPPVAFPDTSAANAAVFGRAKDQAGQTARASLTALQNQMASRGILGSGIEGGNTARIIGEAAGGANEITREQAIQDAKAGNTRAAQEYQGRITQRGQDISAAQANAARQQQTLQGLLSVINSSGILY